MKKFITKKNIRTVSAKTSARGRKIMASTDMSADEMWDYLLEEIGVSEETLQVVTDINGYSEQTMCDILYAVTGYHSFEQLEEE
ncbi:MAG: hypothetical protein NC235_14170 [Clostridiales bacterium]|nr:hypothetical protein [Clostridiales bacterium]